MCIGVGKREEAVTKAKNEQLRANLLRSISHDLRTPLTSISGNAAILLNNEEAFDKEKRRQLYTGIYDDSMWLINLVENLLSVTRLEESSMQLNMQVELVDEVIEEALKHISRKREEHQLVYEPSEELLLAKMDSRLIVQVLINLVENAIKYTQEGSRIEVSAVQKADMIKKKFSICFIRLRISRRTAEEDLDLGCFWQNLLSMHMAEQFGLRITFQAERYFHLHYRLRR